MIFIIYESFKAGFFIQLNIYIASNIFKMPGNTEHHFFWEMPTARRG